MGCYWVCNFYLKIRNKEKVIFSSFHKLLNLCQVQLNKQGLSVTSRQWCIRAATCLHVWRGFFSSRQSLLQFVSLSENTSVNQNRDSCFRKRVYVRRKSIKIQEHNWWEIYWYSIEDLDINIINSIVRYHQFDGKSWSEKNRVLWITTVLKENK